MPRSRRFRKNLNKKKFEHTKPPGKNKNKTYLIIGIIAVAAVVISAFVVLELNGTFSAKPAESPSVSASPSPTPYQTPMPSATPLTSPAGEYSATGTRVLFMVQGTDSEGDFSGNITIQMRDDKPITTTNFVNLVKEGFYDETIFHRVLSGFMIQGGANGTTTADNIQDEIGNDNVNFNGTISMANANTANSANSQFFINVGDSSSLYSSFDTTYTVFGQVIGGMDIVMRISNVPVEANPNMQNEESLPVNPVVIVKAMVLP
jgi:cyclophilin family peptidyl-prolyl cis-trans isomerase